MTCEVHPMPAATGERGVPVGHSAADGVRSTSATAFVRRHAADAVADGVETLVEEVPVALVYNGISHAVMLATPADLEDFALGFSLSEGILTRPGQVYDVDIADCADGVEVRLHIAAEHFVRLKARRRSLAGRTGCGLCGVESLQAAVRCPAPVQRRRQPVAAAALHRALGVLDELQPLHAATGAAHAAAWASCDGVVEVAREDVGRHNALDKLIGALARRGFDPAEGFAVVTSRASVEMVQKAASVGIGMLAAVSAPTAFAVRLAAQSGVTLAAWARAGRVTAYSHHDHLSGA